MNAVVRRTGWALTFGVLALFFQSFLRQPFELWLTIVLAGFTILSAVRPFPGLLLLAAAGPIAAIIYSWGRGDGGNAVFAEAISLAFLTGWTARQMVRATPLQVAPSIRWPATMLAVLAVASGVVHWFGIRAEAPREDVRTLLDWYVLRDYPLRTPGVEPIAAAVVWFSCMILVLAAAHLCAQDPGRRLRAIAAMAIGAGAAATFNVRRILEVALRAEHPLSALGEHLLRTRVSVHYGDKNAAGSYFALTMLAGAGLWKMSRPLAVAIAAVTLSALWLTWSRMAYAATSLTLAVLALVKAKHATMMPPRIKAAAAFVALVVGTAALFIWYPEGRNFGASSALHVRVGLWRAGLAMAWDEPLFGVGLGRFYDLSNQYAHETLSAYGFASEHAHNQVVQVLAELGVPGLAAFIALIAGAFLLAVRQERPRPLHVTALVAGLAAYLLSAMGGHPFVIPDPTYPFWLAVGLAAASMSPVATTTSSRTRVIFVLLLVAVAATLPWRATRAIAGADLEHVSYGFSNWQGQGPEWRYRFMGGRATFYVPSAASAVQVPIRSGTIIRRLLEVTVLVDGREVNRVRVPPDDVWRTLRFLVRKPASGAAYVRIDLVAGELGQEPYAGPAVESEGLILVRRPVIEGMSR